MKECLLERDLADERATILLGQDLAAAVRPGDVVFSRATWCRQDDACPRPVRALAADPRLDVPSPTFTLVHAYETPVPVQAFRPLPADGAGGARRTRVEDSDETGPSRWSNGLSERTGCRDRRRVVALADDGDRPARAHLRAAALHWRASGVHGRPGLPGTLPGMPASRPSHLSGDASARRYERVRGRQGARRILMDSPPLVLGPPVKEVSPMPRSRIGARCQVPSWPSPECWRRMAWSFPKSLPQISARLPPDRGPRRCSYLSADGCRSPSAMPLPRLACTPASGRRMAGRRPGRGRGARDPSFRSRCHDDRGGTAAGMVSSISASDASDGDGARRLRRRLEHCSRSPWRQGIRLRASRLPVDQHRLARGVQG